jgi:hypothetical protein
VPVLGTRDSLERGAGLAPGAPKMAARRSIPPPVPLSGGARTGDAGASCPDIRWSCAWSWRWVSACASSAAASPACRSAWAASMLNSTSDDSGSEAGLDDNDDVGIVAGCSMESAGAFSSGPRNHAAFICCTVSTDIAAVFSSTGLCSAGREASSSKGSICPFGRRIIVTARPSLPYERTILAGPPEPPIVMGGGGGRGAVPLAMLDATLPAGR